MLCVYRLTVLHANTQIYKIVNISKKKREICMAEKGSILLIFNYLFMNIMRL